MKGNYKSLTDLAMEIERIEETKQDYLVSNDNLTMFQDKYVRVSGESDFGITQYAHGQFASKLGIPKAYYDRMAEVEGLRTLNVNAWLRKQNEKPSFVRTLDGNVRALLSNSFRPIDNYDLMSSFLPAIQGTELEVKSCALSEKRLYLQITFPQMEAEVKPGDVVRWGGMLLNSEVGCGAVDWKGFIERLICSNGAVGTSYFRKTHLGSRLAGENADMFKDDTRKAELESLKLVFRDIVKATLNEKVFMAEVNKLKGAVNDEIIKVESTVENVTRRFGLSQDYNNAIVENMVVEKNLNRYGLFNGITALAKQIEDVDKQYECEKIGGMIINMTKSEWGKYVAA